jgi:hypothetical protein
MEGYTILHLFIVELSGRPGPLLDRPDFSVGVLGALLAYLRTLRYTLSMAQEICMDLASQQLRQEGLSST